MSVLKKITLLSIICISFSLSACSPRSEEKFVNAVFGAYPESLQLINYLDPMIPVIDPCLMAHFTIDANDIYQVIDFSEYEALGEFESTNSYLTDWFDPMLLGLGAEKFRHLDNGASWFRYIYLNKDRTEVYYVDCTE